MGETNVILSIKIIRRHNGIILTHEHYVEKFLKKFGHFDVTPMSTPYDVNIQLRKNKGEAITQLEYARIIGSLIYLMNFT